jgi:hypothetical protein
VPSAFHNAIAAGQAAVRQVAGEAVVYRRGAASVEIIAAPGQTRVEVDDASGMVVTSHVRDFLIARATIVFDADAVEPKPGDVIRRTTPAGVEVYEVAPVGGETCFAASGTAGTTLRVHTRLIERESV